MTGIPDFNYPEFERVAQELRSQGHVVYSPHEYPYDGPLDAFPVRESFSEFCRYICDEADAVCLLPGWEESNGAVVEKLLAERIGVDVIYIGREGMIRGWAKIRQK